MEFSKASSSDKIKTTIYSIEPENKLVCDVCGVNVKILKQHRNTKKHRDNYMNYLIQQHIIEDIYNI
jgi:hypothetical protein